MWKVIEKKTRKIYALKEMSKVRIIDRRSERSVLFERGLLAFLRHPFIVNLIYSFQDYENLYLVIDYLDGGDLRFHICQKRLFSEEETKFFLACLILGLEYIHKNNVIHRDIKPENLILESKGYLRITDFGIAKISQKNNYQDTSGTPGYMSPEVIKGQNHTKAVDYFAVGVIGYELMNGKRPYRGKNRKEIKEKMLAYQAQIKENEIPNGWSKMACNFINGLLIRKPEKRLGYRSIEELKKNIWFSNFNWSALAKKNMESPFIPPNKDNYDKKYCNSNDEASLKTIERYQEIMNSKFYDDSFKNFTFYCIEENKKTTKNNTANSNSNPIHKRVISTQIYYNTKGNTIDSNQNIISHLKNQKKKFSNRNTIENSLAQVFKKALNTSNNRQNKALKDSNLYLELLSSRSNKQNTLQNSIKNHENSSSRNNNLIPANTDGNSLTNLINVNTNTHRKLIIRNKNYKKKISIGSTLFEMLMNSNRKITTNNNNAMKHTSGVILNQVRFNSCSNHTYSDFKNNPGVVHNLTNLNTYTFSNSSIGNHKKSKKIKKNNLYFSLKNAGLDDNHENYNTQFSPPNKIVNLNKIVYSNLDRNLSNNILMNTIPVKTEQNILKHKINASVLPNNRINIIIKNSSTSPKFRNNNSINGTINTNLITGPNTSRNKKGKFILSSKNKSLRKKICKNISAHINSNYSSNSKNNIGNKEKKVLNKIISNINSANNLKSDQPKKLIKRNSNKLNINKTRICGIKNLSKKRKENRPIVKNKNDSKNKSRLTNNSISTASNNTNNKNNRQLAMHKKDNYSEIKIPIPLMYSGQNYNLESNRSEGNLEINKNNLANNIENTDNTLNKYVSGTYFYDKMDEPKIKQGVEQEKEIKNNGNININININQVNNNFSAKQIKNDKNLKTNLHKLISKLKLKNNKNNEKFLYVCGQSNINNEESDNNNNNLLNK